MDTPPSIDLTQPSFVPFETCSVQDAITKASNAQSLLIVYLQGFF